MRFGKPIIAVRGALDVLWERRLFYLHGAFNGKPEILIC